MTADEPRRHSRSPNRAVVVNGLRELIEDNLLRVILTDGGDSVLEVSPALERELLAETTEGHTG